ncbi:hypothetical protein [Mycobacteroides abscessus]|uniref:hypothetical protein n=1 Tax=Mycobacteroides abscessus TaxID=36809 RepID=UPI0009289DEC|nr:hypothetical protein [Mycobacteroides abscessus]MDO3312570.1 hypothetical protein [Mycobacteroides abscessus subsp. abscessus]MDO3344748.1 hypothetical protein [Mycobacteroides abscessus subsp. abscessus]QOF39440.1 hypothetical protein E3G66_003644 [Mycobacteroides abscessus]SHP03371.1 Uncharacterised protein [Mycobacteroides abscessus subsp. abscessus]SHP18553.1 Uncharacterised protein [Mycobacteroides abscessus subsp. abscessus]
MLKTWETTLEQDASQFAGLDSQEVFTDLAAGRYVGGWDVMSAIDEVKGNNPALADDLEKLRSRVSATYSFWS